MKFIKAETNGNDFVILSLADLPNVDIKKLADRRRGVGCDQVIFWDKQPNGIYEVVFFNQDGSKAAMCGNGLCALGRYLSKPLVKCFVEDREYTLQFASNTGKVTLTLPLPKKVFECEEYKIVDLGNKHIVSRGDDRSILSKINDFNIHFVKKLDENTLQIETYERGVGQTLACGSGAIASAFAYGNSADTLSGTRILHDGGESFVFFSGQYATVSASPKITFFGETIQETKLPC